MHLQLESKPKLARVSGKETIRALEKLGFVQIQQRGSHVVLKKPASNGFCTQRA